MTIEDFATTYNLSIPQVRVWAYRGFITWTSIPIGTKKRQMIIIEDAKTLNYLHKEKKHTGKSTKSSFKRYQEMIFGYNQ